MPKKLGKKRIVREDQAIEMQPPPEEEFIGSALQPQPDAPRPKTTPYTTSPVTLVIGAEQRRYYVPKSLLQNPQWMAVNNSWGEETHLPDVDEDTGHVLIHYLYTGTYQTLDDMELSPAEKVRVEFKRAVLAYIAAKKYMLQGLQRLAGQQISCFGAEMDIFDVVEAINKDFSRIPDDATWFHKYMSDKARTAFEQDHTVFAKDDLFGRIDSVALIRVLAKVMVEVYSNKVSDVLSKKEETTLEIPEECVVETEDLPGEELPQVECVVNTNEAPTEERPAGVPTIEDVPVKEAMNSGDASGIMSSNLNFGGWSSGLGTQQPPKDSVVLVEEAIPVPEPKPMQSEDDPWSFTFGSATKKKKKKKSGVSIEEPAAEPEAIPYPVHEAEPGVVEEDNTLAAWGTSSTSKKKKKSKECAMDGIEEVAMVEDLPPVPVEHPVLVADEYTGGSKRKKGKKGKVELVIEEALPLLPREPEPEPEPESEPVVNEPPVDPFAGLSKSQKKKLQEKLRLQAERKDMDQQQAAAPAATEQEPQLEEKIDEVQDGWGSTTAWPTKEKKPKKIKKDPKMEEPAAELAEQNKNTNEQVPSTPPAIPRPEPSPILSGIKKKKKPKKTTSDPPPPPDPTPPPIENYDPGAPAPAFPTPIPPESAHVEGHPIEADSVNCPHRSTHLATSNLWKTCKQCRTFLRDVAVELVRSSSSDDETGYEIVDQDLEVIARS